MEEKKVKLEGLPEMTETEAAYYVMERLRGRDLFPEKTARAREFLKAIEANGQRLIP
jgi:hypothetical protein